MRLSVVPCVLTVAVASVLPCVLTVAVDTGQRYPPAVVGPFPLLSVESEREAPEPAVEGAAMRSAMASSEKESVCFTVSGSSFVGCSLRLALTV